MFYQKVCREISVRDYILADYKSNMGIFKYLKIIEDQIK